VNDTAPLCDAREQDLATGLNNCLTSDGTKPPTANLPMNNFKHTGVAAATANGQYVEYAQMNAAVSAAIAAIANQLVPSGSVSPFAGSSAPTGWLLCYGQQVSTATYANLFAVLGTTYGSGSGTFGIPDLRGRSVFGLDNMGGSAAGRLSGADTGNITSPTTLGSTGGEENHSLLTAEMPSHAHTLTDPGHTHSYNQGAATVGAASGPFPAMSSSSLTPETSGSSTTGITINNAGGGSSHNNIPPAMVMNWIIKT
jgi:microcystin-dependent protein